MALQRAEWVFAAEPRSVAQARTQVAERLTGLADEPLEIVVLLTSELVTNAVLHGAGPVRVHVVWSDGRVRVEVADQSPAWPVVRLVDGDGLGGRGLTLVEGLSSGWGVLAGGTGKTVWFTLDA